MQTRSVVILTWCMEALVLGLALLSAWPFGLVHAYFQWIGLAAVACLLACWAGRVVLEGRMIWTACPIAVALAALCGLALMQILPLGQSAVAWLAPANAALYDSLLGADEAQVDSALRTLSLAPGETRRHLLHLIAIFAVFCAVRSNLRNPGVLRRLAWLSAANGVLLAVLGFGQLASSPADTVFWSIPTRGQVFGPFICRNHFAYYVNLCLGLTAGLFLGTRYLLPISAGRSTWRELLRDPRVLWLASALAIMLAGLLGSLSRGGVFGLLAGGAVGAFLLMRSGGATRFGAAWLVVGMAGLLLLWLGHDRISQRWGKLWDDNAHGEARGVVWARVLPLTTRFPLWGSGLGTFALVEPATRRPGDPSNILHNHAHNDFLELGIEGGIGQLLCAGAIIGLVLFKGFQAVRRQGATENGRLAVGAVIGFTAIVVHSFVDFGLHIPAVSLLTIVVAALLANLADLPADASVALPALPEPTRSMPLKWMGAGLQVTGLLAVAFLLMMRAQADERAERYRLAAVRAPVGRRVDYLRAAVVLAPDRADLRVAFADALVDRWQQTSAWRKIAAAPLAGGITGPNLPALAVLSLPTPLGFDAEADLEAARQHIAAARLLSPLDLDALQRAGRLADLRGDVEAKDQAVALMRQLSPSDPFPWFWAGKRALAKGDRAQACLAWRNSLLHSRRYLSAIVRAVPDGLSADELLDNVLPADAGLIVSTLDEMTVAGVSEAVKIRYLRAAGAILAARRDPLPAEDCLLKARIHDRLVEIDAARAAYEAALAGQPRPGWRLEFCDFLCRARLYDQAMKELALLRTQEPNNQYAESLRREIAAKKAQGN